MLDKENNILEISSLSEEQELEIHIPKTVGSDGNNTLPGEMWEETHFEGYTLPVFLIGVTFATFIVLCN